MKNQKKLEEIHARYMGNTCRRKSGTTRPTSTISTLIAAGTKDWLAATIGGGVSGEVPAAAARFGPKGRLARGGVAPVLERFLLESSARCSSGECLR